MLIVCSFQMGQPPSWPATAQLAQLTATTRSPPPQDPDTPLNLSKQRSPSPAPQMMLPRFHPYPQMEEQYMAKEEEYNAACNSEYINILIDFTRPYYLTSDRTKYMLLY